MVCPITTRRTTFTQSRSQATDLEPRVARIRRATCKMEATLCRIKGRSIAYRRRNWYVHGGMQRTANPTTLMVLANLAERAARHVVDNDVRSFSQPVLLTVDDAWSGDAAAVRAQLEQPLVERAAAAEVAAARALGERGVGDPGPRLVRRRARTAAARGRRLRRRVRCPRRWRRGGAAGDGAARQGVGDRVPPLKR